MRIAILGAGMSGLVAANALLDMGITDYTIYDKCVQNVSQQKGLHYLHGNVGLPLKPHTVKNLVLKPLLTIEPDNVAYSRKVWGKPTVVNNSLVNLPEEVTVYNFSEAFELLQTLHVNNIVKTEILRGDIPELKEHFDLIISTIPLPIIKPFYMCESETVYVTDFLPPGLELKDFSVVYNLYEHVPWYRCSKVFGNVFTECTKQLVIGFEKPCVPIKKIKTCEEYSWEYMIEHEHIMLAGRFGEWNRKRLVHEVYDLVQKGVKIFEQSVS